MPSTRRSSDPMTWRTGIAAARILSCMRFQHSDASRSTVRSIGQGDPLHRQGFANFLMRRKIEIARRLFRDARKDWPGDESAIVQLRFGLGVIQHDETDKFRTIGRQITGK